MELTHDRGWKLISEWTQAPHLLRHMLAVEASMRAYAHRFGEDEDKWGFVGLVHDFDYEKHPNLDTNGHPLVGTRYLREQGAPDDVIQAILAHAGEYTGVHAESRMDKTLIAVDELTGFITAVTLVRPSKQIADVEVSSIKKKWKAKEFAAAVNRQEIEHAAESIGMPLDEHIGVVLNAMKEIAPQLGL
jgi:putative nucleotidyltransferase with HDIG domain